VDREVKMDLKTPKLRSEQGSRTMLTCFLLSLCLLLTLAGCVAYPGYTDYYPYPYEYYYPYYYYPYPYPYYSYGYYYYPLGRGERRPYFKGGERRGPVGGVGAHVGGPGHGGHR